MFAGDRHVELTFADSMRELDAAESDRRRVDALQPKHGGASPFDGSVVLLNEIVEILVGAHGRPR